MYLKKGDGLAQSGHRFQPNKYFTFSVVGTEFAYCYYIYLECCLLMHRGKLEKRLTGTGHSTTSSSLLERAK